MKVKLVPLDPAVPKSTIVLKGLPAVIGRCTEANIQLNDRWVSRQHCRLDEIEGLLVVQDLKSRNGTLVNGAPVAESPVMPGDRLTVGLSSFQVQYRHGRTRAAMASAVAGQ